MNEKAFYWSMGIATALGLAYVAFGVYSAKNALAGNTERPRVDPSMHVNASAFNVLTSVDGRLNATVVRGDA